LTFCYVRFSRFLLPVVVCSASLRINFSKRKTGKKKADNPSGQGEKPKGNGISPGGWQGNTLQPGEAIILPCHYAVVFWLGRCVAARYTLAAFLPVDCGKFYSNNIFVGDNIQAVIAC